MKKKKKRYKQKKKRKDIRYKNIYTSRSSNKHNYISNIQRKKKKKKKKSKAWDNVEENNTRNGKKRGIYIKKCKRIELEIWIPRFPFWFFDAIASKLYNNMEKHGKKSKYEMWEKMKL